MKNLTFNKLAAIFFTALTIAIAIVIALQFNNI